ncbi:MAG: YkgJ family cysteine cluster protein [Proteobacteria bacterium]|nr:YkgJ family cysteine cluster protein [Pseudomonadota bacterium]
MKLETDIGTIGRLAEKNRDADWAFRSYLKSCDLSAEEIDALVHKHYKAVSEQIACRKCGNCCRVVGPLFKEKDVQRLAAHLKITGEAFIRDYLKPEEDGEGRPLKSLPCPFLSDNSCVVYEQRPDDCRSYPHLHKKDFVFRLMQAVSNCSICPIVYHVYNRLKAEIGPKTRG